MTAPASDIRRTSSVLVALGGSLLAAVLLTACAKSPAGFVSATESTGKQAQAAADLVGGKGTPEGDKAYWGTALANNPRDEKAAINYARVLKGESKQKAMGVLQQAAMYNPDSRVIASEQGRLAVDLGQLDFAEKLIARAENPSNPEWRLISAKGTIAAKRGDNKTAVARFEEAAKLAPQEPSVLNNLALAYALDGQAAKAEGLLRRASTAGGDQEQVRQNLALVLGVQGKFDEAKQVSASDMSAETAAQNDQYLRKMAKAPASGAAPVAQVAAVAPAPAKPGMPPLKLAAKKPPALALKGATTPAAAGEPPADWTTAVAEAIK